jgi:hypothetical protein
LKGLYPVGLLEGWVFGDLQLPRLSRDEPSIQPTEVSQLAVNHANDFLAFLRNAAGKNHTSPISG